MCAFLLLYVHAAPPPLHQVLGVLTSCSEYNELPVRHNEDVLNTQLARQVSAQQLGSGPAVLRDIRYFSVAAVATVSAAVHQQQDQHS
jgi:hypothetical protein